MPRASLLASMVLLASTAAAAAGEEKPVETEIAFTGKVTALVMLMDHRGQALLTHADPRFALSVEIERAAPADPALAPGKVTTFAIHSPALLFRGTGLAKAEELVGQRFDFSIEKRTEPGRCRWASLRVVKHLPSR